LTFLIDVPRLAEVGTITLLPFQLYTLNPTLAMQHVPIWAEARMRRSRQAAVVRRCMRLWYFP